MPDMECLRNNVKVSRHSANPLAFPRPNFISVDPLVYAHTFIPSFSLFNQFTHSSSPPPSLYRSSQNTRHAKKDGTDVRILQTSAIGVASRCSHLERMKGRSRSYRALQGEKEGRRKRGDEDERKDDGNCASNEKTTRERSG